MIRARWIGAAAITVALGSVALVRACDPIVIGKPTDFSYAGHQRPRVFVSHHPLIPTSTDPLIIRLVPDLPSDATVQQAKAVLRNSPSDAGETRPCDAVGGGAFECTFSPRQSGDQPVYGGFLELSGGRRVDSRAEYRFSVRDTIPADTLIDVRVPINKTPNLDDRYRIDTAFARDPTNYELDTFILDLEQILFDGMLADPVYRWRDDQLGFSVFTHDAFVTSYYSGLNTRCGQNPWPLEVGFPQALSAIEVVGVLHRKATDTRGIEGGVTGSTVGLFRDCAGQAARRPGLRTFSVSTGVGQSPSIAKHEFGHAAFELGDEYTETNGTRIATPAPAPPPTDTSCCCSLGDGTGTGTGSGTGTGTGTGGLIPIPGLARKRCFGPDGPTESAQLGSALPTCGATNTGFLGANCGARPEGGCPLLAGHCVSQTAWLGSAPPVVSTERPNVFPNQQVCTESVAQARTHPGVEDPALSIGTCRELCGPNTSPCPCSGEEQAWIVDNNPLTAPTNPRDAMASVSAAGERHGGTCAWCVETSLCVRWQRALGDDSQKAWETCQAPGLVQALASAVGQIIDSLLRLIVF